jgi:hypothetical protein
MYQPPPSTAPNPWIYYPYWVGDPPPQPNVEPHWNLHFQTWLTCPHCGTTIIQWDKYCPHCGKPLNEAPKPTLEEVKELLEEANRKLDSLSETKMEGKDK